ncbi:MAG: hypothetical protein IPL46_07135 [Saprospiraceae bacterium]|nr:hypothetical protein [Saprospiraceae bacterium]
MVLKWVRNRFKRTENVEFMFIAEQGILESQALLLAESIRQFTGRYSDCDITVISPRKDKRPSKSHVKAFEKLGINYLPLDLKSPSPEYGTSFRVLASAFFERTSKADKLIVLDSDTIFVKTPLLDFFSTEVLARPVDVKGMCSSGTKDKMDLYWQQLCACCSVDYDKIPMIHTTVDQILIKASYNGGFVGAHREAEVFQKTQDYFLKSLDSGLKPYNIPQVIVAGHGSVSPEGSKLWGSSQACLSLAIWGSGFKVRNLPSSHNFPLHMIPHMTLPQKMGCELVHVHYHHLFSTDKVSSITQTLDLPEYVHMWLKNKIPLTGAQSSSPYTS